MVSNEKKSLKLKLFKMTILNLEDFMKKYILKDDTMIEKE